MQFAIVIMAAGKGTRLRSKRPKVLHEVGGKPLLRHVVDAARQIVPPEDVCVIVGHEASAVRNSVADLGVRFVEQTEQRGTGHAMQVARGAMEGYEDVLVLYGDVPLIRPETIRKVRDYHLQRRAAMTILAAVPEDRTGYGHIIRKSPDSDEIREIVEYKALTAEQANVPEINSGIYAFATTPLFSHIDSLGTDNAHGELYLTDMAAILTGAGERVVAVMAEDPDEVLGANTIAEMMAIDGKLRLRTARRLMAEGVTIFRPETSVIDTDVRVGADTVIEPFVQLLGETTVGTDCRIRSYSVLEHATVGDQVEIRQGCVITQSRIDNAAILGPYSHLRPESEIGEGARIGNFVETKKIRMGKGSKANHLTYLGNAEIGEKVNVGAGVITCNYDGAAKHTTVIGDQVFVGSDSTLVAPVKLGNGSYIAAGSCITEDVPEDALALGRARQTIKEGWAAARRRKAQG
ncbi:MAG TPA: bifunctional UDP-N-acetylglucosamine diphosphorylase/glucosamine-1-phosphate N-acetyltransferase GlmU [Acidobacteriaceae bacterium]|nr:bifunctional UDP-N-acetylglucosamine diphosphorylase/glucosamine-1-phosphate N-acetyltransferase GlmU [Acidobacteriaceae bacterium]